MKKTIILWLFALTSFSIASCGSNGVGEKSHFKGSMSQGFDIYGKWYEIGRINNDFERDLELVTIEITEKQESEGKFKVRGYERISKNWKEGIGDFKTQQDNGIKVNFQGNTQMELEVCDNLQNATILLIDKKLQLVWILSKNSKATNEIKDRFTKKIQDKGIDKERISWIRQYDTKDAR